jgi:hypothetical protein
LQTAKKSTSNSHITRYFDIHALRFHALLMLPLHTYPTRKVTRRPALDGTIFPISAIS